MSNFWNALRSVIRERPQIYFLQAAISPMVRRNRVRRDSDLVLEGFPRSANSYAINYFRNCQDREYRIAHHLHAPAQIVYGCRYKIPCMVLLRNPEDAICSKKLMDPGVSFQQMVTDYCSFYRIAWELRDQLFFAQFDQVVSDFDAVIVEFNTFYGTNFQVAQASEEKKQETFDSMHQYNASIKKGNVFELPLPSEEKQAKKESFRQQLLQEEDAGLKACQEIYLKTRDYLSHLGSGAK